MKEAMVSFINKLAWFLRRVRFPSTSCDALLALPAAQNTQYVMLWLCRVAFNCSRWNHKPMTRLLEVTANFCLYCDSWYCMTVFGESLDCRLGFS